MQVEIEIKNVYGNTVAYPVCPKAKIFALMAGTTTLTGRTISLIRDLGYEVKNHEAYKLEHVR